MATATITETGVVVTVTLARGEDGIDRIELVARSILDNPVLQGRTLRTDLTGLEGDIATKVAAVLDAAVAYAKAAWDIPDEPPVEPAP